MFAHSSYQHDPDTGLLTIERRYSGAGPDGVWLTDDDRLAWSLATSHDGGLRQVSEMHWYDNDAVRRTTYDTEH
jgi:hypothetical protein